MKCSKCGCENIIKANYCKECKNKFTKEEREKAYNKTLFGKIELIEKWYSRLTLQEITGHIVFKICSIGVILVIGIYMLFTMGITTKILDSNDYKIYYNETLKEYNLLVDSSMNEVDINLYKPNRLKELNILHYDTDNELLEKLEYKEDEDIVLNTYDNDYYVLESKYSNNKSEKIKVIVYKESDIS